jgi:heterodisulfide reductase subunit A
MDLIAAAVAKVSLHESLEEKETGVAPSVLVIGGGIAGIQASLDIAHSGFEVYLVEKSPTLGGHLAQLDRTFPALEETSTILSPKLEEVIPAKRWGVESRDSGLRRIVREDLKV